MIKFFRRIRQKLLAENRFSKYLIYAIGEIILVVIGILIALQINIWNQQKNDEQKVLSIFKEIQKDLLNDIQETEYIEDWWLKNDTLLYDFLKQKKPASHFKNQQKTFFSLGTSYFPFYQSNQSFEKLNDAKDIIPEKYSNALHTLTKLYTTQASLFNNRSNRMVGLTKQYSDFLYDNYDWMEDLKEKNYTQEIKDYFFTNKRHRRQLVKYNNHGDTYYTIITTIKNQSMLSYIILQSIVSPNDKLPAIFDKYGLNYNNNNIDELIGTYEYQGDLGEHVNIIEKKYGKLFFKDTDIREIYDDALMIREFAKDSLGFAYSNFFAFKITRDSAGVVNGFIGYDRTNSKRIYNYKKVK